ncbi:MAG: tRNA (adenosine(37)-N6)-threonylcarbamoyltransferase complex ATPase subunit type 1 TsaE [Steroidobacteraceae bacterium]
MKRECRVLCGEAATLQLGRQLAASFRAQPGRAVYVHLEGELGAGKTTLVRGMLEQFGYLGPVRSPTFTLLETYGLASLQIVHMDLYRLQGTNAMEGLGLADHDQANSLWLIEWARRYAAELPTADLMIELEYLGSGRRAWLAALSDCGQSWLRRLPEVSSVGC